MNEPPTGGIMRVRARARVCTRVLKSLSRERKRASHCRQGLGDCRGSPPGGPAWRRNSRGREIRGGRKAGGGYAKNFRFDRGTSAIVGFSQRRN